MIQYDAVDPDSAASSTPGPPPPNATQNTVSKNYRIFVGYFFARADRERTLGSRVGVNNIRVYSESNGQ
jgi:hypothetical protein